MSNHVQNVFSYVPAVSQEAEQDMFADDDDADNDKNDSKAGGAAPQAAAPAAEEGSTSCSN
jgi:hypothetical protein